MNFGNMMKQAREMQAKMAETEKVIEAQEVEGVSGGGSVAIKMNGKGIVKKFKIDSSVVGDEDTEILEDLLIAAYNDGKKKADDIAQKEMKKVTGGLPFPPGMNPF